MPDAPASASPPADPEIELKIDGKVERLPLSKVIARAQIQEATRRRFDVIAQRKAELDAREKALDDFEKLTARLLEKHPEEFKEFVRKSIVVDPEGQQLELDQERRRAHFWRLAMIGLSAGVAAALLGLWIRPRVE